ncbi:hypothetical protein MPSEU_000553400 [Mayamaea pseudoterrestris]|nr:hypothetical protein MPSEU_000553400 [Mayamaea pseudoterrestris]
MTVQRNTYGRVTYACRRHRLYEDKGACAYSDSCTDESGSSSLYKSGITTTTLHKRSQSKRDKKTNGNLNERADALRTMTALPVTKETKCPFNFSFQWDEMKGRWSMKPGSGCNEHRFHDKIPKEFMPFRTSLLASDDEQLLQQCNRASVPSGSMRSLLLERTITLPLSSQCTRISGRTQLQNQGKGNGADALVKMLHVFCLIKSSKPEHFHWRWLNEVMKLGATGLESQTSCIRRMFDLDEQEGPMVSEDTFVKLLTPCTTARFPQVIRGKIDLSSFTQNTTSNEQTAMPQGRGNVLEIGCGGISEEVCLTQEASADWHELDVISSMPQDNWYQWAMSYVQQMSNMVAGDPVTDACGRDAILKAFETVAACRQRQVAKRLQSDSEVQCLPESAALSRQQKSKRIRQHFELAN